MRSCAIAFAFHLIDGKPAATKRFAIYAHFRYATKRIYETRGTRTAPMPSGWKYGPQHGWAVFRGVPEPAIRGPQASEKTWKSCICVWSRRSTKRNTKRLRHPGCAPHPFSRGCTR